MELGRVATHRKVLVRSQLFLPLITHLRFEQDTPTCCLFRFLLLLSYHIPALLFENTGRRDPETEVPGI
jgi:hypothetical protein